MPTYIPGISASGTLAPGLSAATVRAVLELLSSAEIAASYLPLAGGTMGGDIDMDSYRLLNALSINTDQTVSTKVRINAATVTSAGVQGANGPSVEMGFANYGIGVNSNGEPVSIINATVRNRLGVDIVVGSNGAFGIGNAAHAGANSTVDVRLVRNATGPTLETRAAGGLKVCNADGSAVAAVQCGKIRSDAAIVASSGVQGANGPSLEMGFTNYGIGVNANGEPVTLINGTARNRLGVGIVVGSNGSFGFGDTNHAGLTSTVTTTLSQASAGVVQIGTTSNNALGSLNLANLTASGTVQGTLLPTQFTVATLPSAAANTGRTVQVTDSSVDFPGNIGNTVAGGGAFNVDVKSDGTNWRITG